MLSAGQEGVGWAGGGRGGGVSRVCQQCATFSSNKANEAAEALGRLKWIQKWEAHTIAFPNPKKEIQFMSFHILRQLTQEPMTFMGFFCLDNFKKGEKSETVL